MTTLLLSSHAAGQWRKSDVLGVKWVNREDQGENMARLVERNKQTKIQPGQISVELMDLLSLTDRCLDFQSVLR